MRVRKEDLVHFRNIVHRNDTAYRAFVNQAQRLNFPPTFIITGIAPNVYFTVSVRRAQSEFVVNLFSDEVEADDDHGLFADGDYRVVL